MTDIDSKVAIAVLQTNYDHLTTQIGEVRDEMRNGMTSMGTKIDSVLQQLVEQKTTSNIRARIFTALSHLATGGATLWVAHLLKIPLSVG